MNGRKDLHSKGNLHELVLFFCCRSELVQVMRSIGNKLTNSIWEGNVKNRVKPQPTALS